MVLHIGQLITLLVQQISRPIVYKLSEVAKHHPKFHVAVKRLGTGCQSVEVMIGRKVHGKANNVKIAENEAFDYGTSVIGEALVYFISASILLYGYRNSTNNEPTKEENLKPDIIKLQNSIEKNGKETENQKTDIEELRRRIVDLENKNSESKGGS